jgi:hypothetical protein
MHRGEEEVGYWGATERGDMKQLEIVCDVICPAFIGWGSAATFEGGEIAESALQLCDTIVGQLLNMGVQGLPGRESVLPRDQKLGMGEGGFLIVEAKLSQQFPGLDFQLAEGRPGWQWPGHDSILLREISREPDVRKRRAKEAVAKG